MSKPILSIFLFFSIIFNHSFAQIDFSKTKYEVESSLYLSNSGKTPFWQRANKYGTVPLESQFLTLQGRAHLEYDSSKRTNKKLKKTSIGYGAWVVANTGKVNQILLPEAYLKARFGALELYAGRRRESIGLVDTTLTSGSYIWSGNAMPLPKIQLSIPNYVSIIGNGLISIKGAYSHGWFGNQGIVKDYYLHQKYIYGRIGKPNWRIKLYAGLNHQVQWGGKITDKNVQNSLKTFRDDGTLPNSLADYLKIVTGVSISQLKLDNKIDTTKFSSYDLYNRSGNHLGSVDLALELFFNNVNLLIYRQSIYDDGSLYYLNNIRDGLIGLSANFKNSSVIKKIVFENLYTKNQGNSNDPRPWIQGGDNYLSHGQFIEGWSYNKNIIGTPFITREEASTYIPANKIQGTNASFKVNNNIINVLYFSTFLKVDEFDILIKLSHSSNYGFSALNLTKAITQNNMFLNISRLNHIQNIYYSLSLSLDNGTLYPKSLGCSFSVRKHLP